MNIRVRQTKRPAGMVKLGLNIRSFGETPISLVGSQCCVGGSGN